MIVALMLILLGGGAWWVLGDTPSGPTFVKRLASVPGVDSVTQYETSGETVVFLTPHITTERLSAAFRSINRIEDSDSFEHVDDQVRIHIGVLDLPLDDLQLYSQRTRQRTAALITSVAAVDKVQGLDLPNSLTIHKPVVYVPSVEDVLPTTQEILGGFATDPQIVTADGYIRLRVEATNGERHATVLTKLSPQAAHRLLRKLGRTLRDIDAQVLAAGVRGDSASVELDVQGHTQLANANRALQSAFHGHLKLVVHAGELKVVNDDGVASTQKLLHVLNRLGQAGAEVTYLVMDRSYLDASIDSQTELAHVLALFAKDEAGLPRGAHVELTVDDDLHLEGAPRDLAEMGPLVLDLYHAGYRVSVKASAYASLAGALEVAPRQSEAGRRLAHPREPDGRRELVRILRSGDWEQNLQISISGLVRDSTAEGSEALRFESTENGKAHDVRYPGQPESNNPRVSGRPDGAELFLTTWNHSAS